MKKINIRGSIILSICFAIISFTVVYAAYTGPDRSTYISDIRVFWERKHCTYEAWYDPAGSGWWGCHADNYTSPDSGCPGFSNWTNSACGWPGGAHVDGTSESSSIEGCSSGESGCTRREEDHSYWNTQNPANVSGTNNCATNGLAGWCRGGATISLSASDPVYSITGIEGSAGMLCSGTSSCTWTYPEGVTNLSFWALSSHGDTSDQSSASMSLDTTAPSASVALSGTAGSGNWFRSSVSVSAGGTDTTSGIGSTFIQVNSGSQQASPVSVSTEGTYSVNSVVNDVAGNSATSTSQTFRIDLTNPSFTVDLDHSAINSWYKAPLTVSATGSDALSGFDQADYTLTNSEGTTTGTLPLTLTTEGTNEISIVGYDLAGNSVSSSVSYDLDLTLPTVTIASSGTTGTVVVSGTASDDRSGLGNVGFSSDNGATWQPVTVDADGKWQINFDTTQFVGAKKLMAQAVDLAGNVSTSETSINIANKTAELSMTSYWRIGQAGILSLIPGDVAVRSITVSICDPTGEKGCVTNTYQPNQLPIEITWDGRFGSVFAPPGEYDVVAELVDELKNTNSVISTILIPYPTPTMTPSPTSMEEITETPEPEITEEPAELPSEQPPVVPALIVNETPKKNTFFGDAKFTMAPGVILLGLFGVLGAATLTDPRTVQWEKVQKNLSELTDNLGKNDEEAK
ncbi:MAG: hypothetical protein KKC20_24700 [Proteobacteria bacterium]|nr:hypothetical protein [Pseudomonadota bacterium]